MRTRHTDNLVRGHTPRASHGAPRRLLLPSLEERMAEGRPVITRERALSIAKQVIDMSSADKAMVYIRHIVKSTTSLASDRVRDTDDGDTLLVQIRTEFGDGNGQTYVSTNQLDEQALREMVTRADDVGKAMIGWNEQIHAHTWDEQDKYPATNLYHQASVDALHTAREATVPKIIETVSKEGFKASGFVGVMARADAILTNKGIVAFSEETDCEVDVTCRPADGKTSGWAGTSQRDWAKIDPVKVAAESADIAKKNMNVQALEPGRRTAILTPAAVVQLMRFFVAHFDGYASDDGRRGFSKLRDRSKGSKFKQRLFDPRVKVTTDPADPIGGFKAWFEDGYVNNPTTWVENGELKFLSYGVNALDHGKAYSELPYGFRLHGGDTSIEQMIAQCEEGILVNRFSSVDILDWHTGMMTGVTRDGCFLVRHGKIDRPVKNFRFLTSPFFFFFNIMAMGQPERAVFGYAPWTDQERATSGYDDLEWPRRPMVVPPMMVRDFNFSALVDAV